MSTTTDYATMPVSALRAIVTSLYTPEYRQSLTTFTELPPGVTPVFEDPPNSLGKLYIALGVILLVISTIVVGLRFYTRTILTRALGWDDWTCLASLVLTYVWTGTTINSALLGMGIQGWNLSLTVAHKEDYAEMTFFSASAYIAALALVKVSLLILYLRTFTQKGAFRITLWMVLILIVLSHAQVIIVYWAEFANFYCQWRYNTIAYELWVAMCPMRYDDLKNWVFVSIFTVILDVIVLILPIHAIWKLQMVNRQKIAVSLLVAAGGIVTIIGLVRFIRIYDWFEVTKAPNNTYLDFPVNLCSTLELNTAIVCTSLPPLKAFIRRFSSRLLGTSRSGHLSQSVTNNRTSKRGPSHPSALHSTRASRKRPGQPDEESQMDGSYLELVDGKSTDQNYNMTTKLVDSHSSITGNSH